MNKLKKISTSTIILLIILLNLANILVSGSYATQGSQLQDLLQQKLKLEESIRGFEQKILQVKSIKTLSQKAESSGFQKPTEIVSITQEKSQVASLE